MIPDYQSLMRPVLDALADGQVWSAAGLRDVIAQREGVTDEERLARGASGSRVFDGRVHWAITYLSQALCVLRVGRGRVEITDRGRALLASEPGRITTRALRQFPEFVEFMERAQASSRPRAASGIDAAGEPASVELVDPEEQISEAIREIETAVAAELVERIKAQPASFLERIILDLMLRMNYGATLDSGEHLGGPGDEGFDGVIYQDALGLERVYLQAKRYADATVGRPAVQAFAGALQGAGANRGVFITTSRFSADAREFADRLPARVVLIDGVELGRLLVKYRVGTQVTGSYEVVSVDEDFFETN